MPGGGPGGGRRGGRWGNPLAAAERDMLFNMPAHLAMHGRDRPAHLMFGGMPMGGAAAMTMQVRGLPCSCRSCSTSHHDSWRGSLAACLAQRTMGDAVAMTMQVRG